MTKTPVSKETETLKKVRVLLARPFGWGKGYDYTVKKNKAGKAVDCYCLRGAVFSVNQFNNTQTFRYLSDAIRELFPNLRSVVRFNDNKNTTKKDVIKVVDRAIELSMGQK